MKKTKSILLFISLLIVCSAYGQSKNIKNLENKRKQTLLEIENTNKLLLDTKKTATALLNRIKLISSQINSRQELVSILNQELSAIDREQKRIEGEIKTLEVDLKDQQKKYAAAIDGMIYKRQNKNRLLFVLSGKSFGESLRRLKYLKDYSEWRNQQAIEIIDKKQSLTEKRQQLVKSKKDKIALLAQRRQEEQTLKNEENIQKQEVAEATKKQTELQGILKKKQQQADALNKQIERLIAEEVARQEREAKRIAAEKAKQERAKAAAAAKSKETATTKPKETTTGTKSNSNTSSPAANEAAVASPTETKENFNLSRNFASNKGRYPMPITGRYSIVSRFGAHRHAQWNITTKSNGVDIQAQSGAEARSIFEGEVSTVMAFPGFNNCIIVRHGGYYTFYGNIQQVFVRKGQRIAAGQSLGVVYTDPETGASQMHFQLWQGTTKLNPEHWLKK